MAHLFAVFASDMLPPNPHRHLPECLGQHVRGVLDGSPQFTTQPKSIHYFYIFYSECIGTFSKNIKLIWSSSGWCINETYTASSQICLGISILVFRYSLPIQWTSESRFTMSCDVYITFTSQFLNVFSMEM